MEPMEEVPLKGLGEAELDEMSLLMTYCRLRCGSFFDAVQNYTIYSALMTLIRRQEGVGLLVGRVTRLECR